MCITARNGKFDMFHDTPAEAPGRSMVSFLEESICVSGEDVDFGDLS